MPGHFYFYNRQTNETKWEGDGHSLQDGTVVGSRDAAAIGENEANVGERKRRAEELRMRRASEEAKWAKNNAEPDSHHQSSPPPPPLSVPPPPPPVPQTSSKPAARTIDNMLDMLLLQIGADGIALAQLPSHFEAMFGEKLTKGNLYFGTCAKTLKDLMLSMPAIASLTMKPGGHTSVHEHVTHVKFAIHSSQLPPPPPPPPLPPSLPARTTECEASSISKDDQHPADRCAPLLMPTPSDEGRSVQKVRLEKWRQKQKNRALDALPMSSWDGCGEGDGGPVPQTSCEFSTEPVALDLTDRRKDETGLKAARVAEQVCMLVASIHGMHAHCIPH